MQILFFVLGSALAYEFWWIAFVGLVFCAARYTPWPCIPVAFFLVAAIIVYVDVTWVQAEMSKPGWDGLPDMDIVFWFGVLFRIALVSIILVPIAIIGYRFRRRSRSA